MVLVVVLVVIVALLLSGHEDEMHKSACTIRTMQSHCWPFSEDPRSLGDSGVGVDRVCRGVHGV